MNFRHRLSLLPILLLLAFGLVLAGCGDDLSDEKIQRVSGGGGPPNAANVNFDDGTTNGWALTGQWHITSRRSVSPSNSLWFGNEATGWFEELDGGGASIPTSGEVRKTVTFGPNPFLDFDFYNDGECGVGTGCGIFDAISVQISTDGGATWTLEFWTPDNANGPGVFTHISLPLAVYANQTVEVRFFFDTVDGINNQFEGGFIDNVVISSP